MTSHGQNRHVGRVAAFWLAAISIVVVTDIEAKQSYISRIPNVPTAWPSVGHLNPNDGHGLSSFGHDFKTAHNKWTVELCRQDSDHDGRSNGEELGDYDCEWSNGQPKPTVPYAITNPGMADNFKQDDATIFKNFTTEARKRKAVMTRMPAISPTQGTEESDNILPTWLICHIIFGVISVGFVLPLSMTFISILRKSSGGAWKSLHVNFGIVGSLMLLFSFALPMYFMTDHDFDSTHTWFGIVCFVAILVQSASGLVAKYAFSCPSRFDLPLTRRFHSIVARFVALPLLLSVLLTGYDRLQEITEDIWTKNFIGIVGGVHVVFVGVVWLLHEFNMFRRGYRIQKRMSGVEDVIEMQVPVSQSYQRIFTEQSDGISPFGSDNNQASEGLKTSASVHTGAAKASGGLKISARVHNGVAKYPYSPSVDEEYSRVGTTNETGVPFESVCSLQPHLASKEVDSV